MVTLGERLRMARTACGFTQDEVARALSLDRSSYSFYETGKNTPKVQTLQKLAKMFKVSIVWLLGEDDCLVDRPNLLLNDMSGNSIFKETDEKSASLSGDEKLLLLYYRQLDEAKKSRLIKGIKDKVPKDE